MCPKYNKVTNFGKDHQEFAYGYAIEAIIFRDGKWWAINTRCSTPIKYCPFCGVNLYTLKETEHIPIKISYPNVEKVGIGAT
jgi:hypothetical protein